MVAQWPPKRRKKEEMVERGLDGSSIVVNLEKLKITRKKLE